MPKYKYKFCDGTTSEVEVNDEQYALLTAMDKQERMNDRHQGRRTIPLDDYLRNEEKTGKKCGGGFKEDNE